jgi:hypothetical protein
VPVALLRIHLRGERRGRACPTLVDFRGRNQGDGKPSPYITSGYRRIGAVYTVKLSRTSQNRPCAKEAELPTGENRAAHPSIFLHSVYDRHRPHARHL